MGSKAARLIHWTRAERYRILRYLLIGGVVFGIDLGCFTLALRSRLPLPVATSVAYLIGVSTHFTLNRWFNFRNFDRSVASHARTYATVVAVEWVVTVAVVQLAVTIGRCTPIVGRIVAVLVDLPLGYTAHRYVTFAGGIAPLLRHIRLGWERAHDRSRRS